jgi:hypothetical protein
VDMRWLAAVLRVKVELVEGVTKARV